MNTSLQQNRTSRWKQALGQRWREQRGRTLLVGLLALCYALLLLLSCCPGLFRAAAGVLYPQVEISGEDFFEQSPVVVGVTLEDGVFTTTESGWIYLHYDTFGVRRPATVSVTYNALSQESLTTTWYYVDSYRGQAVTLTQGENQVVLKGGSSGDYGLRLDMPEGITYELESVVVNDSDLLARIACSLCRRGAALLTVVLGLAGALWLGNRLSSKARSLQTRLTAGRDAALASTPKGVKGWLLRHFARFHYADGATLCWTAVTLAQFWLCRSGLGALAWGLALLPLFALGLRTGGAAPGKRRVGRSVCFGLIAAGLAAELLLWLNNFSSLSELLSTGDAALGAARFWVIVLVGLIAQALLLAVRPGTQEGLEDHLASLVRMVSGVCFLYPILETALMTMARSYSLSAAVSYVRYDLFAPLLGVNLWFACLVMLALTALCGPRLATVLASVVYLVLLVGNGIKILYQGTMFKPIDLTVVGDLFRIMPNFIGKAGLFLLGLGALVLVGLLVWQIKRVARFLRPCLSLALLALALPALLVFCAGVNNERYDDVLFGKVAWLPEITYWRVNGSMAYNYYNCIDFLEVFPSKPEGYSKTTMEALEESFDQYASDSTGETEVEPDVILIMAESLFDVSQLEGVTFSVDPTETIRSYQVGNIVSSRYGGGTAGVEFEGITGFSNLFFLDDLIAYTTYMNDTSDRIPSIATAFSAAGYETTALHLNDAAFYNREHAYQILGFDQFRSITDFTFSEDCYNLDGYVQDQYFFNIIEEQLESAQEPQFIFGVTIECHNPYDAKFAETEIQVTSDLLGESATHQLEQYAQAVLNFDRALASFLEYIAQRDRPTVVYIWGDHLPALSATTSTGYLTSSTYAKYTTPFIAYSNYGTVTVDTEYMTPNQITPQILTDVGIAHSSYYDYIYSLRETYPVLHHGYTSDLESEELQNYWLIQYDLMFGNQYLKDD